MSVDSLASVRFKIERAKHHVQELDRAIVEFRETGPYEIGTKKYPETGYIIHYAVRVDDPPMEIAGLAGEAIHQLRSALDHLAVRLVLATTPGMSTKHVYFPISDTPKTGVLAADACVKGMGQDAIDAIDRIEPHKGGAGHDLWLLHKLNNIDKHRMLVTVVHDLAAIDYAPIFRGIYERLPDQNETTKRFIEIMRKKRISIAPFQPMRAVKPGDILLRDMTAGSEPENKADFLFAIAFNEPPVIEGAPILETLHRLTNVVEVVVSTLSPFL